MRSNLAGAKATLGESRLENLDGPDLHVIANPQRTAHGPIFRDDECDRARVLGSSKVLVYHRDLPTSVESPYLSLASGETLDLVTRRPVLETPTR